MARRDRLTTADVSAFRRRVVDAAAVLHELDDAVLIRRSNDHLDVGISAPASGRGSSGGHSDPTLRAVLHRRGSEATTAALIRAATTLIDKAVARITTEMKSTKPSATEQYTTTKAEADSTKGNCSACGVFCDGTETDRLRPVAWWRLCVACTSWMGRRQWRLLEQTDPDGLRTLFDDLVTLRTHEAEQREATA